MTYQEKYKKLAKMDCVNIDFCGISKCIDKNYNQKCKCYWSEKK